MDEFFPILRHPEFKLPWRVIAPHEAQAQRNHYQTLEQLARRGGLSFVEAFCVLTDTHWSGVAHTEANERRAKERIEGMVRTYQHPYGVEAVDALGKCPCCGDGSVRPFATSHRLPEGRVVPLLMWKCDVCKAECAGELETAANAAIVRAARGVQACRAVQRVPSEWSCDCAAPGPNCRPTGVRRTSGVAPTDGGPR